MKDADREEAMDEAVGKLVNLSCEAHGFPLPSITWHIPGNQVRLGPPHVPQPPCDSGVRGYMCTFNVDLVNIVHCNCATVHGGALQEDGPQRSQCGVCESDL